MDIEIIPIEDAAGMIATRKIGHALPTKVAGGQAMAVVHADSGRPGRK